MRLRCRIRGFIQAALAIALLAAPSSALAGSTDGFMEFRAHGMTGVEGKAWQTVQRARPTFSSQLGERLTLNATIELGRSQ